jgi:protein-S-isoprenylcysteine O-methyltransferase Ste14
MKSLELRIPPPVVALCLAALMWLLSRLAEPTQISFEFRLAAALALLVTGQVISIAGMRAFRRAKTTMNPFDPKAASSLVIEGVYRFTRNPMYVGLALALVGWTAFLASPLAWVGVVLFVLYINQFQIKPEERVLSSLFGAEYSDYTARVRRWL